MIANILSSLLGRSNGCDSDRVTVIVGKGRRGEVFSEFKSAGGRTVRVLDRGVYEKALASADKKLREITAKKTLSTLLGALVAALWFAGVFGWFVIGMLVW